jgi:hypothetical protein
MLLGLIIILREQGSTQDEKVDTAEATMTFDDGMMFSLTLGFVPM